MALEARTLLQLLIRERGWTYERFKRAYAQAVQELATTAGQPHTATATVEEQTFRRWTAGRVKGVPNAPAPEVLERIFGHNVRDLLGPPPQTPLPQYPQHVVTLDESELAMTARDAAAHAGSAASLNVPDMTLDQLDDDVAALAQDYGRTSPVEVYRRAKELLGVSQALLERTEVPRQKTRAYLAAGKSAALLAGICFDLGALPTAVSLSRTAALYGQVIEHGPLQAYAHGSLALLAYWSGRPAESVRLIQRAQTFSGLGDTAHVRLSTIEGRAHAHLADRASAEHAMRNALEQDTGTRDELHDDIAGEFGFPRHRVSMSAATTYILLGDAEGAEASATATLKTLASRPADQRPYLITTQASVDLAHARLLRRELDGAHEALDPVFSVPTEWRGAGTLERISAVRAQLARMDFGNAAKAASLGEQIEEFSAAATAQRLGPSGPLALEG